MSVSLSHLNPNDYVYFSSRTANGCAGKPVKIHKDLAVAFITAVNPASEEGQTVIRGIEQLTALAQDTQAQATDNAAAKTKDVGCLTVCYTITQAQGDRASTVYITNFRQRFASDRQASGLYRVKQQQYGKAVFREIDALTHRTLFINGLANDINAACENSFARLGTSEYNLFYTSGDDFKLMGAWSQAESTKVSASLAKVLNTYSGADVTVYVEGYGAHVLHSALPQINNLSKFSFVLENPVTNIASLIQSIDAKKGKYSHADIVKIYPGHTDLPEFNASKVALAYSRLSLCNKVLNSGSGDNYAFVLVQLYHDTNVPTNKLEEGKKYLDTRKNFTYTTDKNIPFNTFIECVNKMAAWR
jgi:hypothetical protein